MIFQGIQTSIAKKPYFFCGFPGGGGGGEGGGGGSGPPVPPLGPHMWIIHNLKFLFFISARKQVVVGTLRKSSMNTTTNILKKLYFLKKDAIF